MFSILYGFFALLWTKTRMVLSIFRKYDISLNSNTNGVLWELSSLQTLQSVGLYSYSKNWVKIILYENASECWKNQQLFFPKTSTSNTHRKLELRFYIFRSCYLPWKMVHQLLFNVIILVMCGIFWAAQLNYQILVKFSLWLHMCSANHNSKSRKFISTIFQRLCSAFARKRFSGRIDSKYLCMPEHIPIGVWNQKFIRNIRKRAHICGWSGCYHHHIFMHLKFIFGRACVWSSNQHIIIMSFRANKVRTRLSKRPTCKSHNKARPPWMDGKICFVKNSRTKRGVLPVCEKDPHCLATDNDLLVGRLFARAASEWRMVIKLIFKSNSHGFFCFFLWMLSLIHRHIHVHK